MPAIPKSTARAVLWMLAAIVCFCLLAVASRELTATMGMLDIVFWRSLLGFVFISIILRWQLPGALSQQGLSMLPWHFLRNISHFGGQYCWLFAIAAIPLAEVFALEFTTPLWSALLAAVFLGEALNRHRLLALVLGLVGVLIILRPGVAAIHPASLLMLLGTVGYAISIITTRHLTLAQPGQSGKVLLILFFMTGMQMIFALLPLLADFTVPALRLWPWILTTTLTALGAHFCLSRALSLADAAVVMPIDYLRLPLIMVLAWFLYDEAFNWAISTGALLIITANLVGLGGERSRLIKK